jgi:tRNA threonylcarbamoyladenosine modification (KEOPS) complex  Pcc1 subunit
MVIKLLLSIVMLFTLLIFSIIACATPLFGFALLDIKQTDFQNLLAALLSFVPIIMIAFLFLSVYLVAYKRGVVNPSNSRRISKMIAMGSLGTALFTTVLVTYRFRTLAADVSSMRGAVEIFLLWVGGFATGFAVLSFGYLRIVGEYLLKRGTIQIR